MHSQKYPTRKSNFEFNFHKISNEIQENIRQIFALLFQRLSLSKTAKYVRGFIGFLCFYAAKIGGTQLVELIDSIQAQ